MTLVLSMATGSMVLHVSDRLLTADRSPWDARANKSLVVLGSDGWACVSYSGLAYVDSKPTDQWLAEALSGHPSAPPLWPDRAPPIAFGGHVPRVGPALDRVRGAIQDDFMRQLANWRSLGMQVEVTGFILRRRGRRHSTRARPFMRRYTYSGAETAELQQNDAPRHWDWSRQILVGSIGVNAGDAKTAALSALGSLGSKNEDDCERILVECLRRVSENNPTVGADCMSIVLSRHGDARVRFLPDPDNDSGQTAYTPWILAPRIIAPPMVLTGRLPQLVAGPFLVEFERLPPLPPSPLPLSAGSQPRRRFP